MSATPTAWKKRRFTWRPDLATEPARRWSLKCEWALFVGWLIMIGIALWLHPSPLLHGTHKQIGMGECGFYQLFHRPCPTCGLTTSFAAVAHLDIVTAVRAHVMGPWLFLLLSSIGAACGYSVITGRRFVRAGDWVSRVFFFTVLATVGYGLARLPFLSR